MWDGQYAFEKSKIIQGYSEIKLDLLKDESVDMFITSPPYDDMRNYSGNKENFNFHAVAKRMISKLKNGGVIVWIVSDKTEKGSETTTAFRQAISFVEYGMNLHDTMIWEKPNPMPTQHSRYQQAFEYMFVFSNGKPKTFNPIKEKAKFAGAKVKKHRAKNGDKHNYNEEGFYKVSNYKTIGNVWSVANSKNKTGHIAIFPEKLIKRHILTWTNKGDLVVDNMAGSGTTGEVCIELNRDFILIEKEPNYYEVIKERVGKIFKNYGLNLQPLLNEQM